MGCPKPSPEVAAMTEECIAEARPRLSYKVCWREFAISGAGADGRPHTDERPGSDGRPGGVMIPEAQTDEAAGSQSGASLDLGFTVTHSRDLQKNLKGCCRIILFGATVGLELDRLIARYGRLSPSKALCFQAIGAERIESLCNVFNDEIDEIFREQGMYTRPSVQPRLRRPAYKYAEGYFRSPRLPPQDRSFSQREPAHVSVKVGHSYHRDLRRPKQCRAPETPAAEREQRAAEREQRAAESEQRAAGHRQKTTGHDRKSAGHGQNTGGCASCAKSDCIFRKE